MIHPTRIIPTEKRVTNHPRSFDLANKDSVTELVLAHEFAGCVFNVKNG